MTEPRPPSDWLKLMLEEIEQRRAEEAAAAEERERRARAEERERRAEAEARERCERADEGAGGEDPQSSADVAQKLRG